MKGTYVSIGLILVVFMAIVSGYFIFRVKSPVVVVQNFYTEWIDPRNDFLANGEYKNLKILSDVSKQKIENITGTSTENLIDPVVCSQSKPDSFTASLVSETLSDARVLVIEKFGAAEVSVRVDVVAQGNSWIINSISCGSGDMVEVQNKVADYIRDNISQLSSEKAVLGGTFFVTKILFNDGNGGTVEYEDGHVAYRAEFMYSFDNLNNVHVDLFKIL